MISNFFGYKKRLKPLFVFPSVYFNGKIEIKIAIKNHMEQDIVLWNKRSETCEELTEIKANYLGWL